MADFLDLQSDGIFPSAMVRPKDRSLHRKRSSDGVVHSFVEVLAFEQLMGRGKAAASTIAPAEGQVDIGSRRDQQRVETERIARQVVKFVLAEASPILHT